MSYEAAVAWSIVRSLLAGALCLALARRTGPLARPDGPMGPSYILLLVPFFMPGLVVGYAYRNASLSLVQTPLLNELLYLAIVVAQLTPVVVLALEWLPAAELGPSGAFLLKLAEQSGRRTPLGERLRAMLAGELPRQITAAAIAALLCFQEVEVATLMQARGWAEWIFTKQAGGVELLEVLPFLVLPVGYGLLLTVPVLGYWTWDRLPACQARGIHHGGLEWPAATTVGRAHLPVPSDVRESKASDMGRGRLAAHVDSFWRVRHSGDGQMCPSYGGGRSPLRASVVNPSACGPRWRVGLAIAWVAVSWLLTVVWPVGSLVMGAIRGRGVIQFRAGLWQEIGDALVLGVTVTWLLWLILWSVQRLGGRRLTASACAADRSRPMSPALARERLVGTGRIAHPTVMRLVWGAALLPGLLGSLALGLTIFEICQRLGVQPSYSPVPLVVAMVLFLLPRALAMQAMLRRNVQQAGVFLAESLAVLPGQRGRQGAAILWRIRDAGRFWTLALLFWWSYLELTLPALLRPAGMAPAPLRLYNFLHYGHIPGLAAMLGVVLAVPVVLVVLVAVGRGLWIMVDGLSTGER